MAQLEQRKTPYFARLLYLPVAPDGQGIDRLLLREEWESLFGIPDSATGLNFMESRDADGW